MKKSQNSIQINGISNGFIVEVKPMSNIVQRSERKEKRFNLMFKPSVYAQLQEAAAERSMSVGSLVNLICLDYLKNYNKQ